MYHKITEKKKQQHILDIFHFTEKAHLHTIHPGPNILLCRLLRTARGGDMSTLYRTPL